MGAPGLQPDNGDGPPPPPLIRPSTPDDPRKSPARADLLPAQKSLCPFATEPARRVNPLKAGKTTLQPLNLNPEEETHAKDAMHAKEGIDPALTIGVTRFLSDPLRVFLPWRALRPLREIQLLFLG